MSAYTQPPSKSGVTGVTRVTPLAKRPVSLVLTAVTPLSGSANIQCNAAPACNAKVSTMILRAAALHLAPSGDFRWLSPPNSGRGTSRCRSPEIPGND